MPIDEFGRRRPPRRGQPADYGPLIKPILLGVLLLAVLVLGMRSFYTVEPNEQAVLLRFGEYRSTQPPGLHFRIPFVDTAWKVSIEEHGLRIPGGSGRPGADDSLMLTGDLNAASVDWTVQWKVADPERYLFAFEQSDDPEAFNEIIRTASLSVMNRLVGDYSIDEVLTSKRNEIESEARTATQGVLDDFECGVTITDLQLQRITPPAQVKPAFDDVNAAIQDRDRSESEAAKERNKLIPDANARRDRLVREAEGYAARERAEIDGEIAALRARYEAYRSAPDVTRQRLYLEAMQTVLEGVGEKTILDSDLESLLPMLQLTPGATR